LSSEGRLNSMESRFQKKSGEIIIGLLSSVIVNVRGNMVLLSSVYDITERKQNEIKLEHYSEQLRKEKVTKDKFFSIIAHDLRSPFQTLLSASEILARDIDSLTVEEIKTLSSGLNASLKKQYLLLTDLLNWSKLQAKDFALEKKMLTLNQLISEVLETLAFSAEEKKIKIQYDIPEGTTVFADNNMLKLVMRNLISNSIKFTNVNGTIDICAGVQGDTAEISVIDDGVGIAAQNITKLFRDDLRYSTIGTGDEEGSGLGLNLCREIIEKHGGTIRVESAEGQGSKFSFTLPSS
ncbi:MAG: ATP-binding protein, partial [Bacteroidota bacterium]